MKSIILAIAILLTGCATPSVFKDTQVLVQKEYIVRKAPDSLKTLPPFPPPIDNPFKTSNTRIASWINDTEAYAANLEAMIKTLVEFYEKPVTPEEKK